MSHAAYEEEADKGIWGAGRFEQEREEGPRYPGWPLRTDLNPLWSSVSASRPRPGGQELRAAWTSSSR